MAKPNFELSEEAVKRCNCGSPESWERYDKRDAVCHSPYCPVFDAPEETAP